MLNFSQVLLNDPHSKEAIELINKAKVSYPKDQVTAAAKELNIDVFCYPDAGALHKYQCIYESKDYVYCTKAREPLTGEITGLNLLGEVNGRNVLIVDDICDGGYTFVLTAKKLLTSGAKSVSLFVSHGLFTKGLDPLIEAGITNIYTKEGKVL